MEKKIILEVLINGNSLGQVEEGCRSEFLKEAHKQGLYNGVDDVVLNYVGYINVVEVKREERISL